jgi:hypothetical protein
VKSSSTILAENAKTNVSVGAFDAKSLPEKGIYDVNGTGKIDLNDSTIAHTVYNVMKGYDLIDSMGQALKSDVNHDKQVNVSDVNLIITNYSAK